jgi:membrane-bound inhibitor of C-type lysozyme
MGKLYISSIEWVKNPVTIIQLACVVLFHRRELKYSCDNLGDKVLTVKALAPANNQVWLFDCDEQIKQLSY